MTIFLNFTPKTIISVIRVGIKKSGRLPAFTRFGRVLQNSCLYK